MNEWRDQRHAELDALIDWSDESDEREIPCGIIRTKKMPRECVGRKRGRPKGTVGRPWRPWSVRLEAHAEQMRSRVRGGALYAVRRGFARTGRKDYVKGSELVERARKEA